MKISFFGEFPRNNNLGGSHTVNFELVRHLSANSRDIITAYSPIFKGDEKCDDIESNYPNIKYLHTSYFRSKAFGDIICKLDFAHKIVRINSSSSTSPAALFHIDANPYLLLRLRRFNRPMVLFLHGGPKNKHILFSEIPRYPYSSITGIIDRIHERKAIRIADHIFINSQHSRDHLINNHGLSDSEARKVEVVKLGFNNTRFSLDTINRNYERTQLFEKLGIGHDTGQTVALFIGGFSKHKGQIDLIRYIHTLLSRREIILFLAGKNASGYDECAEYIKKNKLEKFVFLFISPTDLEIGKIIKSSDVYVSASTEGFGISLVEAMAAGLPLLAFEKGAVGELFESGKHGYLVHNEEEFSAKLCEIIDNPNLRSNFSNAAKIHAKEHFSWKLAADKVHATYAQCIEKYSHLKKFPING